MYSARCTTTISMISAGSDRKEDQLPRRTFFSFHYKPDVWRAWNVRNSWVVKPDEEESIGFFDSSVFEASQKEGDDILKSFLRNGLKNTSVTCILAGTDTWRRWWVRYEVARSVLKRNGLLTVFIHSVQNHDKEVAQKGANPLAQMGLYKTNNGIFRAGSVRLNSSRVSINGVLPGLRGFLPHRGWHEGRA